jgi:3-hydroxybutyryl-CoA dehydrogenase
MLQLNKVGVLGAGMMGGEIALCFAIAGCQVVMKEPQPELAQKGKDRLAGVLDRAIAKGRFKAEDKQSVLARLLPTGNITDLAGAQLLVEAVFEDLAVKTQALTEADQALGLDCLFCTNTSSIPITQLAALVRPERRPSFLGAHFFSPASVMKLVEVIPALETSEDAVGKAMEACRFIGKTPVRVADVPGFAVNRLLHAMLIEACRLVEEGVVSPEDLDLACKLGLGHPVGPLALMDLASNQLCLQVQDILYAAYGERFLPRPILKQKVHAGHLGRKTGRGWFGYQK